MKNLLILVASIGLAFSATAVIASDSEGQSRQVSHIMKMQQDVNDKINKAMASRSGKKIVIDYSQDFQAPEKKERLIVIDYSK